MCYLIAQKFKESESIAFKTKRGKGLAYFVDELQDKMGYGIQLVAITRPSAYGEYEPYEFVESYEDFEERVKMT